MTNKKGRWVIKYTCNNCGETFYDGDNEKAIKEKNRNFPDVPLDDCAVVCDDCYIKIMTWINQQEENNNG